MFVTGPDVIKAVTHEEVTKEELGGALTHAQKSGVAHFAAEDDRHCLLLIRELLNFLPSNNLDDPPIIPTQDKPHRVEESFDKLIFRQRHTLAHPQERVYVQRVVRHWCARHMPRMFGPRD